MQSAAGLAVDIKTDDLDRRDLRRGGSWTRRQKLKNALLFVAIRCALFFADRTPRVLLVWAGRALGLLSHALLRSMRRDAQRLVERALPSVDARRLVRRSFANAGQNLALCLLLRRPAPAALELVEVDEASRRTLDAALARGRGAVFVSPHLGPFELVAAVVAELGHQPVVVVRESYDPRLDPVVDAHRKRRGVGVVHRGDPGAAVRIVRALRAGHPVGLLPDLASRVPGISCRMLGGQKLLAIGPQRIALRCGSPLLVGALGRPHNASSSAGRPGLFSLEIRQIEPCEDEAVMTQRVANALSAAVERMPEHWLWMAQRHR